MERLTVVCARLGLCSRSEAARYIRLGLISVDGELVQNTAALVSPEASVALASRAKRMQANKVTLMLHKPLHYVSCRAGAGKPLARSLLVPENRARICQTRHDPRQMSRLSAVDALDESLTGLLLFSQDGRVATHVARNPELEKEYTVQVVGDLTPSQLVAFREGLALALSSGGEAAEHVRCDVVEGQEDYEQLQVTVRGLVAPSKICQMCDLAGLRHKGIARTRIGRLRLGDLGCGQWTVVRSADILGEEVRRQGQVGSSRELEVDISG